MTRIVIVGSGIIGLYTAFTLLEHGESPKEISVIAEYLPGDESIKYTSPYAGGNFSCITGDDEATLEFDKYTYLNLGKIQKAVGKINGLDRYKSTEFWDERPSVAKINSLKSYLQNFEELNNLPQGSAYGISFLSWNFNCPKFLYHFKLYLERKDISFSRSKLNNIKEAFGDDTKVVFNCTGIGARELVNDKAVHPGRGQVVVIKAPHIIENVLSWGNREPTYIIKRPFSHDQLILGGFLQEHDWNPDSLKIYTDDILKRTTTLFPKILEQNPHGNKIEDLEILRVAVGLRPCRTGGARIEKEVVDGGKILIHNYGASGYGYQAGLGMAEKSVKLMYNDKSKL